MTRRSPDMNGPAQESPPETSRPSAAVPDRTRRPPEGPARRIGLTVPMAHFVSNRRHT